MRSKSNESNSGKRGRLLLSVLLVLLIISLSFNYYLFTNNESSKKTIAKASNFIGEWDDKLKAKCFDKDATMIYNGTCNEYLDELDEACEDTDSSFMIFDEGKNSCIDIVDYERSLFGCSIIDNFCEGYVKYPENKPLEYNNSYKNLIEVRGEENSGTIIMFSQGGPIGFLADTYAEDFHDDYMVAYVHQTNTLNPVLKNYNIGIKRALNETAMNKEIIKIVYEGLKEDYPDKKIVLMGHSMGSFLILDYLTSYENTFDKIVHLGGRFNVEKDFLKLFMKSQDGVYINNIPIQGRNEEFEYNVSLEQGVFSIYTYKPNPEGIILASMGMKNYLELLKEKDLSNMLVQYSSKDERVGSMSEEELDFFDEKDITYLDVGVDEELFGHSAMFGEEHIKDIKEFIEN